MQANPFALMMEPQQVLQAVEGSTSLRRLRNHQYLLLDRPASLAMRAAAVADADARIDAEAEEDDAAIFDEALTSESVGGSTSYQSFPRLFN